MSQAPPPPTPELPPMKEYKSAQYEFNDEQNRQIAALANAMWVCAGLMQLMGLALLILTILSALRAHESSLGYAPTIGLGAATLLCLCIGFWTGGAADSFHKIVETRNEDIWHLMNALGKLRAMFSLLRTLILGSLVLAVVALALVVWEQEAIWDWILG